MQDIPAESNSAHQIKVIGQIDIIFRNVQIRSKSAYVFLQDQELGVRSGTTAVYKGKMSITLTFLPANE